MATFPSNSSTDADSPAALPLVGAPHLNLTSTLLDAAMQAQRSGTLEDLVRKHPLAARWVMRKHWRVICGTAGDALPAEPLPWVAGQLLRWLVTQLRPDAEPSFSGFGDEAWLQFHGWRPMLAVASHVGLLVVPDFPRQYRRHVGEAPLDNLCGLWRVDSSTLYRLLEKGRQTMTAVLVESKPNTARRQALRALVASEIYARQSLDTDALRQAWHRRQREAMRRALDPASTLWHCWFGADYSGFVELLFKHAAQLAVEPETDALANRIDEADISIRVRVDLWLARGALARARNVPEQELRAYEQARQVAKSSSDPLLLGIIYSALGKFFEPRDADRAFACYQDSADFLRGLAPKGNDTQALAHFVTTYARLAWLYLLRNDPRSKAVLDRAEELRASFRVPEEVLGVLEQVWGQYWRRAGDSDRSIEHRYRALNIFERLADHRSTMAAYVNIGFDLAARGDYDRAIDLSNRVLQAALHGEVDSEVVVSAHLNLGATHFWKRDFGSAIAAYRTALDQSLAHGLRLHAFRARYNLAEAHYSRFRAEASPEDESAGDDYVAAVLAATDSESIRSVVDAARLLKSELLGHSPTTEHNRLIPGESAIHFDELTEIHRQREILAVPADPESHAQAHLVIARAYAAIAAKDAKPRWP
jgi:tetratricopeptide (TPR) repeat protein